MHSEIKNEKVVRFSENVTSYFNDLISTLFWQNYFGSIESSFQYIADMKNYLERNMALLPKYRAPRYFSRYQKGMQYVTYQSNKRTTWFFFFLQQGNRYLICYVTNNHFEGQYIR
jgi:hypothetical protein